jgi:hypothetical protein
VSVGRRVDVDALRTALAGFEELVAAQAHLPISQRMRAVNADGTVIEDVASASVAMCKRLIAEAERDQQ